MRTAKYISIYFLILTFIYMGAGVPIANYCAGKQKMLNMSENCCCGKKNVDMASSANHKSNCCKTSILKISDFEKVQTLMQQVPVITLYITTLLSFYQPIRFENQSSENYYYPPDPGPSRQYLSLFCTLVI